MAKSREDLEAGCKALDRVLLWNHYVVPQWSYNNLRVARWDRFDRPDPLPEYGVTAFPKHLVVGCQKSRQTGKPMIRQICDFSVAATSYVLRTLWQSQDLKAVKWLKSDN